MLDCWVGTLGFGAAGSQNSIRELGERIPANGDALQSHRLGIAGGDFGALSADRTCSWRKGTRLDIADWVKPKTERRMNYGGQYGVCRQCDALCRSLALVRNGFGNR